MKEGTTFEPVFELPPDEAIKVCEKIYSTNFVMLKIQISTPTAMQINRHNKVSFSDQLGVLGIT